MSAAVTLFHVSDLHFGMEDRAALDWFAHEVAEVRPDGVICTGDLTMRGRTREFAAAADYLGGLPVPVSVEPGNHDMPYYWEPITRLARPHARFEVLRKAVHRDLAIAEVALVSLPTIAPAQWRLNWSKGRVASKDLAHALAHLGANKEGGAGKLRLVACHHPLIEAGTHATASTRGGPRALAALARAGVDAVLSGHVHDAFDRVVEAGGLPIRVIGAGTLSERVRSTRPSYNRLEWSVAGGLSVTVRSLG
ncbi:MAG: metallophosphoesterase [Sphingomonadales bacterium]|nr:metallophosphoesterase [Sphingomonadales bacterium]